MESIIATLAPYLDPTNLALMAVIAWQFIASWKREKVIGEVFKLKDDRLISLFSILNTHTDAINRLLGFLDGQRRDIR